MVIVNVSGKYLCGCGNVRRFYDWIGIPKAARAVWVILGAIDSNVDCTKILGFW